MQYGDWSCVPFCVCRFFKLYICLISCSSSSISCHYCGNHYCQVDQWKHNDAQIATWYYRFDIILEALHRSACSCHCIYLPLQWYAINWISCLPKFDNQPKWDGMVNIQIALAMYWCLLFMINNKTSSHNVDSFYVSS